MRLGRTQGDDAVSRHVNGNRTHRFMLPRQTWSGARLCGSSNEPIFGPDL